jgi:methyl-accepting chemotaxis protein
MKGITIRQRLIMLVAFLGIALVFIGVQALRNMSAAVQGLETVYLDRVVPLKDLKAIADAYAVSIVDLSHKTRNGNVPWEEAQTRVAAARTDIDKLWRAYLATYLVPKEVQTVAQLKPLMATADQRIDELERILRNKDQAVLDSFTINELYPAIDPVSDGFSALVNIQTEVAKEVFDEAHVRYEASRNLFLLSIVLVLGGAGLFAWRLVRGITEPLARATAHCAAIAEGDLTQEVEVDRHDEIGQLLDSLATMSARLRDIVGEVRDRSASINTGAHEIAEGNLDLSQRTEEQAASLEETASSMDQMTSTVQQNAENAARCNQLANDARQQAEKGGSVVSGAVTAMAEINDSSMKIAQIITVVDEIAFQTNLLALNAAVEAARAGEQGRGFAVVATEVRNLAQRSAQAAKEIKTLINDSVEKVTAGSRLVNESGAVLGRIVEAIKRVTLVVSEIASASREQSEGIRQVNLAINQMDQITQQNAALVEEAASAAKSLEDQAEAMKGKVSFFRTGTEEASGSFLPRRSPPAMVAARAPEHDFDTEEF